ncbi:MAG: Dam family site-specific DNA-(adenine-N6)-methyltransferase [Planctomycetota bacterium]
MAERVPTAPRPFLRWAGSKRQLVKRLKAFWKPRHKRYVEPFAGSSVLYFAIRPEEALLADKNPELIEAYEVIREHPVRVHNLVTSIKGDKATYYEMRRQEPEGLSRINRVVRFVYLNRYCFNGLYRTNLEGRFNVPYAASGKTGRLPTLDDFKACANLLKGAVLRTWDFGTTVRYVREGDFVYLDPPYAVESRRVFREYGAEWFNKKDLIRLAEHLKKINERGASFVVSYADCAEARSILGGWNRKRIRVRRNIAGFEGARRNAYELLFFNEE